VSGLCKSTVVPGLSVNGVAITPQCDIANALVASFAPSSMDELLLAIGRSRNTSPGPDGIHDQLLSRLSPSAKEFLLSVFNRIWEEHCFPSSKRGGDRYPYP
jgi:hypothetical protein